MSCRLWPKGMLVCRSDVVLEGLVLEAVLGGGGCLFFLCVLFAILFYSLGAIWSAGFSSYFFLLSVFEGFHSVGLHLPYCLTIFSSLRALIRPTWLWHVALLLSFLLASFFSGLLFRWGKKKAGGVLIQGGESISIHFFFPTFVFLFGSGLM